MSRLRLLAGMVHANRPWRLVTGMSKVMMAAFATGAVSLAYPTIWQLSVTMGPWRLSAATILASAAMIAWLIVEHDLWERPQSADERDRAVLYNASTVVTLTIGVIVFHAGLFVLLLVTAWWTLPPQLVAQNIGQPFDFSSLLLMAWLVSAVATLGGALGSGMEDDEAVEAAAYGVRQRQRFENSKVNRGPQNGHAA
jgi:magnesium-transporting ATPase (P-type)